MQINERYVRALLENAGDVMAVASSDGRLIYIGGASLRVFGYEPEAVVGSSLFSFIHPSEEEEARRRFQRRIEEPDTQFDPVVFRVRHADGVWRHVEAMAHNLVGDADVQGIVLNVRDVSDRVAAEQRLRASEALYQTLAESAPVGIFQTDRAGRIVFTNPRFETITGLTREQASGEGWRATVHPDDRVRLETEWQRCMTDGSPLLINLRFVGGEGSVTSVFCQGSPLRDADGAVLGCVGTLTDMTEYVRTVEALQVAVARTNAIVDAAADAILTADEQGTVFSFNRAAEEMFGIPAADIVWHSIDRLLPAEDSARHAMLLRQYRTGQITRDMGRDRPISAVRGDGTLFPVELSVSCTDVAGRRMFTSIIRDVTERRKIETELIRARDAAQAADRAKSAFLQVMSHELRTPLNAVIGFAQVIEMRLLGARDNERYTEYAGSIRQSGEHLLALIDDILDITKIESGDLVLTDSPVDLGDLMAQAVNLIAIQADKRNVTVTLDAEADLPAVSGDALRLRQVLVNLLSNAVKFSHPGGAVTSGARRTSDQGLELYVRDGGIGMAAEDIPKALSPFHQIDQSVTRSHEGTGLGLPISKRLVEAHGGTLVIESQPGQGTTVSVHLPQDRVLDPDDTLTRPGF